MSKEKDNDDQNSKKKSNKKRKTSSSGDTGLDPSKDEFGIVLPRMRNAGFDSFNFTELQTSYYKDTVDLSLSVKYHALKTHEQKTLFVYEVLREKFQTWNVYKYDESKKRFFLMSTSELFKLVRDRLVNIKTSMRRDSKKRQNNNGKAVGIASMTSKPIPKKTFQVDDYLKSYNFRNLYDKSKILKHWNNWHYYSMFHSLFQSFSFVVYNYSHKLADKELIHRSTRLKLNFPSYANAVLIIHGRLVHSGSASKYENILSYNQSHDVRLFSYLHKDPSQDSCKNSTTRKSSRLKFDKLYKNNLHEGEVDTRTFSLCNNDCSKCISLSRMKEVNIEELYQNKDMKVGHTVRNRPILIAGDMDLLGWAVYTGVNVSQKNYSINLEAQLRNLVEKQPKKKWHGINNTDRRAFKLDSLVLEEEKSKADNHKLIYTLFDDIKLEVLSKIKFLGKDIIPSKRSILANFSHLQEQEPHRDYASSRIDDSNAMSNM